MKSVDSPSINWPRCAITLRENIDNDESAQQCADLVKKRLDDSDLCLNDIIIASSCGSYCLHINAPFRRDLPKRYIEALQPLGFIEKIDFEDPTSFG